MKSGNIVRKSGKLSTKLGKIGTASAPRHSFSFFMKQFY